jgi:regulatory protein
MTGRGRKQRPPLNAAKLDELALHYVGRFATSKARLRTYLGRKIRERGWSDEREPDVAGITDRLARLGYVDDAAFAAARARSLTGRGYGARRVGAALHSAGIAEDDREAADELVEAEKVNSALRFAERRRVGPFAAERPSPEAREKAIGAMLRAGHRFALARAIVTLDPGEEPDREALAECR